ncbi:Rad4 transglutaminase-like domain-containing protein [Scheffersomyces xylosifermentans]|uniref:Rad4 transglutaminase-like domain-containing protein n=1 Tax=Scheffersomyces xylosifermentans TaxID=1304137 RepID=UPI00315CD2D3
MVLFMLHGQQRNKFLSSHRVLKCLKKMLPESLMRGHVKKFNKAIKNTDLSTASAEEKSQLDVQFVYILKYLIKWFRLNYKIDSNGIRVLGYIPQSKLSNSEQYHPKPAPPIANLKEFTAVVKRFKHNRDTGAQIFTALMRSLGFEARLVFSLPLQPISKDAKLQPEIDFSKLDRNKDNDLLYPYFWTEVVNPLDSSELFVIETVCFHNEEKRITRLKRYGKVDVSAQSLSNYYTDVYFPISSQFNQMSMHYVIAYSSHGLLMDVSSRYMTDVSYRWFNKLDLRTQQGRTAMLLQSLLRYFNYSIDYTSSDNFELNFLKQVAMLNYRIPTTLTALKKSPNLVTLSTLRYNESIPASTKPVKTITLDHKTELVFFKNSVVVGKSEKQWKFLGRSIKPHLIDQPVKISKSMPPRTIANRRRYNHNISQNTPELNNTKLYSFAQTCAYLKLEVTRDRNGQSKLPRNEYGNIEIFRDCMIPGGCVWLKLSGIESILSTYKSRRTESTLEFDLQYVPVIVGFTFTSKAGQAIPIRNGVLVLKEQEASVKKIWLQSKISSRKIEISRRRNSAFAAWRELLKRLQIKTRLEEAYGVQ